MESQEFEIKIKTDKQGYSIFQKLQKGIVININEININLKTISEDKDILLIAEFFGFYEEPIQILRDRIDFFNIYSLFLNFRCDISYYMSRLYIENSPIEQNIHIRHIYNDIFRHIERFNARENMKINMLCNTYLGKNDMDKYTLLKRDFNKEYKKHIHEVRNSFSAHFDKGNDYLEYYQKISEIEPIAVYQMCLKFLNSEEVLGSILGLLNNSLTDRLNKVNSELMKEEAIIEAELRSKLEKRKNEISQEKFDTLSLIINKIYNIN